MHQWTQKHKKPCPSLWKTVNQSLQHGSFFINTGQTGKWRIEFHSAIFLVIIEKSGKLISTCKTRDLRRFSIFSWKAWRVENFWWLKDLCWWPNLKTQGPAGPKVFSWNSSPRPARSFNFLRRNNIYQIKSTTIIIILKTDSYLFSFLAMRRSLAMRAFTRAFVEKLSESIFQWPTSCVSTHKLK